jgi:hypothetical protein
MTCLKFAFGLVVVVNIFTDVLRVIYYRNNEGTFTRCDLSGTIRIFWDMRNTADITIRDR